MRQCVAITDLELATVELDSRVAVIEENGNQTITELEVRVDNLEETTTDHETRLTAAEENIQGKIPKILK